MSRLDEFSDQELVEELERRKKVKEASAKPKPLDFPDFTPLVKVCKDYIDDIEKPDGLVDDDWDTYIFEEAVLAVFGKDVWAWVNEKLR